MQCKAMRHPAEVVSTESRTRSRPPASRAVRVSLAARLSHSSGLCLTPTQGRRAHSSSPISGRPADFPARAHHPKLPADSSTRLTSVLVRSSLHYYYTSPAIRRRRHCNPLAHHRASRPSIFSGAVTKTLRHSVVLVAGCNVHPRWDLSHPPNPEPARAEEKQPSNAPAPVLLLLLLQIAQRIIASAAPVQ